MLDLFEPNLLENIFLNAPIGIFITDIQRKIIYANIRSAGIHGYKSSADLMEQTFPNFLDDPTDLIKNLCDILDFSINKKKVKYEFTVRSQKRIVETTMSVLKSPPNSPVGFIFFCENITERAKYEKEISRLNITDSLTSLHNQRYLYYRLEQERLRASRNQSDLSLILLDIDSFKDFNDSYGHLEGDKVLIEMGTIINNNIRKIDLGFRYGGEEFIIILPCADLDHTYQVADRIRTAFSQHTFSTSELNGKPVKTKKTISMGISTIRKGDNVKSLIKRADVAMYKAKNSGGNRITLEE